jgi:molybdenum cofactor cytidylyltransferase
MEWPGSWIFDYPTSSTLSVSLDRYIASTQSWKACEKYMKFGPVLIDEAEGAILTHSIGLPSCRLQKGHVLSAEDIQKFRNAKIYTLTVARLEPDDVAEDVAARRLATAIVHRDMELVEAVGGRINLIARSYGILTYDTARLNALNAVHESLTVAALPPHVAVEPGRMVATIKVIPLSVPEEVLRCAETCATDFGFEVVDVKPCDVGLIQTVLPGTSEKVLDKTSRVTTQRLQELRSKVVREDRCDHQVEKLAETIQMQISAGVELVLVVGASAVIDRRDVIPTAIETCAGTVEHFGMPVDPGNLMLLASVGDIPVLGVPGCARSPKKNGFDLVLRRLLCGLPVSADVIMAMGAGGLLKEIAERPMPRSRELADRRSRKHRVYILVLAATDTPGFWITTHGVPNIARVADAASKSAGQGIYVVTGEREKDVSTAISDYPVSYAFNPSFNEGISTSLRRGLSALPADADAAIICLGNDPAPSPSVINALICAFDPENGQAICMSMRNGKRVNPMLIGRRFFAELHELEGDIGARYLVGAYPAEVVEVLVDETENPSNPP